MERLLVVLVVVAVVVAASALLQRRRSVRPAPAGTVAAHVPLQLDRGDLGAPPEPWLLVLFSSSTCLACAEVREKAAAALAGWPPGEVALRDVPVEAERELHQAYGIDSVPLLLVVDPAGAVRRWFLGPVSALELTGALDEARLDG